MPNVRIVGPNGRKKTFKFTREEQADKLYDYLIHTADDRSRIEQNNHYVRSL